MRSSQQYKVKLPGLDETTPGVILYGVSPDDKIIPIQLDNEGRLVPGGSTFSYFSDHIITPINATFSAMPFNFSSRCILLSNDSQIEAIEFSFDDQTVHGRILSGEEWSMDNRLQNQISLRTSSGNNVPYRLMVY